MAKHRTISR